jgi:hypothetical protein
MPFLTSKTCCTCKESKPIESFSSRKGAKDGRRGQCKKCMGEVRSVWAKKNREKLNELNQKYRDANREHVREVERARYDPEKARIKTLKNKDRKSAYAKEFREKNPEVIRERSRVWALNNKDKIDEMRRNYRSRSEVKERLRVQSLGYRMNDRAKYAGFTARRRAQKAKATPLWINEFFVEEAYSLSALRTKQTGIKWEVDHIVPLVSELVCGLHAEHNLQVIPESENRSKSNRHWPDM